MRKITDKAEIIRLIESGVPQAEVARQVGVSRERIRQIYEKDGTKDYKEIQKKARKKLREKKLKELKKKVRFFCDVCGGPVFHLSRSHKQKYCSNECADIGRQRYFESLEPNLVCTMCEKPFFKFASLRTRENTFCERACFVKFLKMFHNSPYSQRMKDRALEIRRLTARLNTLEVKLGLKRTVSSLVRTKQVVRSRGIPLNTPLPVATDEELRMDEELEKRKKPSRPGTCRKCTVLIVGEFARHASLIKPGLCKGCDGSHFEIEYSLTRSGVPVSRR